MKLVHISTFASSFKFFPINIFLLFNTTPSESSLADFIKYLTIGKVPLIKSSPALRTGKVFVGLYAKISLHGFFNLIIFGGKGRNFVTNSINLQGTVSSKANKISF